MLVMLRSQAFSSSPFQIHPVIYKYHRYSKVTCRYWFPTIDLRWILHLLFSKPSLTVDFILKMTRYLLPFFICLHVVFTWNPVLCHAIMNISKASCLHPLLIPVGYYGHMFVRMRWSSSSLEETIAHCTNMELTQLTVVLFLLRYSWSNLHD